MSQALMNEVKSLKARVEALQRHVTALEHNLEVNYQRKRGPKPVEGMQGRPEAAAQ